MFLQEPHGIFGRVPSSPKPSIKGCVVGKYINGKLAFGLCTTGRNGAASLDTFTPFGVVSSGLEVLRDAFKHTPITEVTVTHCGLVLPGFVSPQPPLQPAADRPVPVQETHSLNNAPPNQHPFFNRYMTNSQRREHRRSMRSSR